MPELLLELFSEEIPARMQAQAAEDLKKLVTNALVDRGLTYEGAASFATPRRLALHIAGLPARQPDTREEKKGPRVGAPEGAIQGFLKSAGLTSLDQAKIESDPKKGEFYVAHIERAGRATTDVLAEILPTIIKSFPWPKSMRWGASSSTPESLRYVRPLHSILCTFGSEQEEPEIVDFEVDGIRSGNFTFGHRFLAPAKITVRRFDDYVPALEKAKVVLDAGRRRDIILHDARNLAFAQGLELVEDDALLAEVAGLVEWPVPLVGEFDEAFLDIPGEVIRATIRANQKCFVLRKADGNLANKFILVSNIIASDGGIAIAAGNGRVVRARLSDALYFWQTDRKPLPDYADAAKLPLDQRMAKLRALNIVFHEKLGTQGERVARIKALAKELAPLVGANADQAVRAAELAKADLMTEVVGEFPEVQGLMGRRYAALQGEDANVCAAIEEHYKPQGPSDYVPSNPVSVAVALADKIDTLVGFWAIDEKPTGSKDPYALRRAALGVIRLVLENDLRINLKALILGHHPKIYQRENMAFRLLTRNLNGTFEYPELWQGMRPRSMSIFGDDSWPVEEFSFEPTVDVWVYEKPVTPDSAISEFAFQQQSGHGPIRIKEIEKVSTRIVSAVEVASDLLSFFADRLKVYLRDKGARHDLIDAVLNLGEGNDDLLMVVRRVEALGAFLDSDAGKNLLAGYKRASNILKAEEKKDGVGAFDHGANIQFISEYEERALKAALDRANEESTAAILAEDFAEAMRALSKLREPVDAFFEKITVNADEAALRKNRLALLGELRAAVHKVADFSKIAG